MTPRGARKALGLVLPLTRTVDVSLGRYSTQLDWYALRGDKDVPVWHDASLGSVRVKGLETSDRPDPRPHSNNR